MQSMILNSLYLKSQVMSNMNSNFLWSSNFLLVGGRLVGGWYIWLVAVGRWSVVGWSISRWSVLGGRLVGGLKETLKTQNFRKLGTIRKFSNLGGDITQCPVSAPEIKLWQQQSKNTQKQILNFSVPVQFYQISLICSKYFVQDCRYQLFLKRNIHTIPLIKKKIIFANNSFSPSIISELDNLVEWDNPAIRKSEIYSVFETDVF